MFLTSVLVPSVVSAARRALTFASTRRLPSSMLTSLTLEVLEDLLERAQIGARLRGRAHVRLAHDLDERHAGAIEVDGRDAGIAIVHRLAGVFLHVHARDADRASARRRHVPQSRRTARSRAAIELRDLVALRQVGIEVVLAREDRHRVHGAAERERGARGQLHCVLVQHRQRTRQRETHRAGVRVRRRAELGGAPAEGLRARLELHVDLEPDDHLPVGDSDATVVAVMTRSRAERTLERIGDGEHLSLRRSATP